MESNNHNQAVAVVAFVMGGVYLLTHEHAIWGTILLIVSILSI